MADSNWQNRQTRKTRRPRRLEEADSAEIGFPVIWVIIGAISGLLVIGLVGLGVVNIIRKQSITPTPVAIPGLLSPQITSEANPVASSIPAIPPVVTLEPTATPLPTNTPLPAAPDNLAPGVYAQVTNTDGYGVSLRAGPGTNNARVTVVMENATVLILDGPKDDKNQGEYIWWFVRAPNGTEGWTAQDFLLPTLPPQTE